MSRQWIDSFPDRSYAARMGAYRRWCDAIPKQVNGFKFVYPMLEWPMYPFRHIKPGEFFAVPTGKVRSARTLIHRMRSKGVGLFSMKLSKDGKAIAVFRYK